MKRLLIVVSALCISATGWAEIAPIHFDAAPPPQSPAPAASVVSQPAAPGHEKKPVRRQAKHHRSKKAVAPKQGR